MKNTKPLSSHGKSKKGLLDSKHSKQYTILKYMQDGGSLNRFEAEDLGDHCLHSTISIIEKRIGLLVSRKWEKIPNRFGTITSVKRYWIDTN